jgi:DNA-directed RNA polymerase III subunit RPC6
MEAVMIYRVIENSGEMGTWKRTLTMRTNLHENTVTKSLKELCTRGLIKEIRSAKHPTRRIYMLYDVKPSKENTGGTFFVDGEMDSGLVEAVGNWIVNHLHAMTWAEQEGHPKRREDQHQGHGLKRKRGEERTATMAIEEAVDGDRPLFKRPERNGNVLIAYPANHKEYPTAAVLKDGANAAGFLKNIELTENDISQLLQKLEFDGLVERMRDEFGQITDTYRSVRKSWSTKNGPEFWYGPIEPDFDGYGPGNGLTQSPCGRCPVFKQCRPGGAVSPETCVYMDDWLKF